MLTADHSRKNSTSSARVSFSDNPPSLHAEAELSLNHFTVGHGTGGAQGVTPAPRRCSCTCSKPTAKHRRGVVGVLLMIIGSVSWVGTTYCAIRIYIWPTFYAPYFVVYLSSTWLILFYPVFVLGQAVRSKGQIDIREFFRESCGIFGEDILGPSPYRAFGIIFGFCFLWDLTAYLYLRGLSFKGTLDCVALFATNSNFVYLMSWIVLQKKFIAIRIVAFIVSMTGIIVITYMESGSPSHQIWGSVLVMLATVSAAAYKVLFRRVLGDITYDQVACFITGLGLCNLFTMWPLFLVLYLTQAEPLQWDATPWNMILSATAFALVLNLLLQFGAVITYHLLIHTCFILAIPVCIVAEILVNGQENFQLEGLQIGAYILIGFGFLLNILPEDWHTTLLKLLRWKRPEARHQRESVSGRATPKPNRAQSGRATPKSRARSQAELNNSYC